MKTEVAQRPGIFKVNGRLYYFGRISSITKQGKSTYVVLGRNGMGFVIEGGRHAGGTSRDWFLDGFGEKSIVCTSLIDALRVIENA